MRSILFQLAILALAACAKSDASPNKETGSAAASSAVHGVGIGEQPVAGPTDIAITDHVRQALLKDKEIGPDAAAIRIATQDGAVTLRGFVSSDIVKQRAAVVTQAVGHVVHVENQLVVDPEILNPEESTVDSIVSDHVRRAILEDKDIGPDAAAIRIATKDGVVTLRGFVRTDAVKQRIAVVAKAVGNVVRIDNRLVVDPEAAKTQEPVESYVDRLISSRVRQAILADRTLAPEARTVFVRTQDGVVRLTGTVSSEAARARMGVVANAAGSVKRVANELAVPGK